MEVKNPIYLNELAEVLDRTPHAIRLALRTRGKRAMPSDLRPTRTGGRRYLTWDRSQIPGLKKFFEERAARKGWQPKSA